MKSYKYKTRTPGRYFKTKKDTRDEQKFRLEVFMDWMPNMKNNESYFPRTSYFKLNFDAHSRRGLTIFLSTIYNKIVRAKSTPHMKLTLGKIFRKKTYRKKL